MENESEILAIVAHYRKNSTKNPKIIEEIISVMKKIKTSKKPLSPWLKALKETKIDVNQLSLKELKAFKDLDHYLNGPIEGPVEWQYLLRSFRFFTSFAFLSIYEQRFPPLSKCWEEMDRLFARQELFDDEVFVQSWAFCDFSFGPQKQTALDYFEDHLKKDGILDDYRIFIDEMRKSRLGLYQETLSSKKTIKLRELFTGNTIEIVRSIPEYEKGEIFLMRPVKAGQKVYCFGDPKCWPKEYKSNLETMIQSKLFYFEAPTIQKQYEDFMKYAGPYWMSCVMPDPDFPILAPDHFLEYLKK